ncbi:hypothetical protein LRAMOSA02299 [Lichtheimia ramosa]|uniref:Uncharacterized protein n=1 Tax=Lichtheimia ramosa TaxID=688394 RepID=A0A077WKT4_9FUNG|nr:hypothetical protein LRAMOSA02299 [Lichtheimia ramosa]
MAALGELITHMDATLNDLARGDNQRRFRAMAAKRNEYAERLNVLQQIQESNAAPTTSSLYQSIHAPRPPTASSTNLNTLVPRNLPAFQLQGGPRHNRNNRFDSVQSFMEEFRTVLEGHSLVVEDHWHRLMPMTVNPNGRA